MLVLPGIHRHNNGHVTRCRSTNKAYFSSDRCRRDLIGVGLEQRSTAGLPAGQAHIIHRSSLQPNRGSISANTSTNCDRKWGLTGQGFGQGQQTRGEFVPEQHTDFIFSVIGEEFGFVGSVSVLALFAIVMWRCMRTARKSPDLLGTLICCGVMTLFAFQMFQSVGMTLGIMPITGIPIPFVSYGGSSAISCFVGIGLVLNIHMRRYQVV
ncbi:MAG: hypothetical protein CM15mP49_03260 [Actinomycetota bacterium]|nr:MAG: hypothetical protein CM15mP49_03260 [Actinomycetota bacterium]